MEYLPQLGSVMDTLQYSMLYFSYSLFEFRQKVMYQPDKDILDDTLYYFNLFRMAKRRVEPAIQFYPFFSYHGRYDEHFAAYKYFWNHLELASEDPEAFFDSFASDEFFETCMNYYFEGVISVSDLKEQKPPALLNAMAYLGEKGYKIDAFVAFLSDFDELVKSLIGYLKECYARVDTFRNNLMDELLPKVKEVLRDSEADVKRMCSIPEEIPLENQKFTVHIMDYLSLLCKRQEQAQYIVFACAGTDRALEHWGGMSSLTLRSFGEDFGNDVSFDIIQRLRHGEKTAAQLAKELFASRSTTDRYIKALKDNQVVLVSRQIGTEVYYTLNGRYFLTLKSKIVREVNQILEDICKYASTF